MKTQAYIITNSAKIKEIQRFEWFLPIRIENVFSISFMHNICIVMVKRRMKSKERVEEKMGNNLGNTIDDMYCLFTLLAFWLSRCKLSPAHFLAYFPANT